MKGKSVPTFSLPRSPKKTQKQKHNSSQSSSSPLSVQASRRQKQWAPHFNQSEVVTSRRETLLTLHRLIEQRQCLNNDEGTASLRTRRNNLKKLAAAAIGIYKRGVSMRAIPANYSSVFTKLFHPCPNVFTTALSLDMILSFREIQGAAQLISLDLSTTMPVPQLAPWPRL